MQTMKTSVTADDKMKTIRVLEGTAASGKKRKKVIIDLSDIKDTEEACAEEQVEDFYNDLELVLKLVLNKIEFELSVENDGIGTYQFGSSNEYDAGTNYLSINDDDHFVTVLIILGQVNSLAAKNLLRDCCLWKRLLMGHDLEIEVKFSPVLSQEVEGYLSYKMEISTD